MTDGLGSGGRRGGTEKRGNWRTERRKRRKGGGTEGRGNWITERRDRGTWELDKGEGDSGTWKLENGKKEQKEGEEG